jgi:methylmalonyl-CoA/ethylmalonyl-CoA epimerase
MYENVDHIGIATPDVKEAVKPYLAMGFEVGKEEIVEDQGVKLIFVKVGNTRLEFLEPISEDSAIAKFLQKNPRGGIHHIAIKTDSAEKVIEKAKENSIRPLSDKPKKGAHNTEVVFMHPKDMSSILIEFVQEG